MKVVVIKPGETITVSEKDITWDLETLRKLIGCDIIEHACINDNISAYVNENGIAESDYAVKFKEYPYPIAGNIVLVGSAGTEHDIDCPISGVDVMLKMIEGPAVPIKEALKDIMEYMENQER